MPFEYRQSCRLLLEEPLFQPDDQGLEPARGPAAERRIRARLRAEVRDPLWFLTRQWQFGELQGEDAGSPIEARLLTVSRRIDRYRPREGAPCAL